MIFIDSIKLCGIYCIENIINHKKYIGQSIDIKARWAQHRRASVIARDTFLYQSMRKHGLDNFKFYIIEECSKEQLNDREMYWIKYYDSYKNGYNMTPGGNEKCEHINCQNILPSNFHLLNENIENVIPIVKLDNSYNIIAFYESVQECARQENLCATNISKTASGKHKTCKGNVYMYLKDILDKTPQEIKLYREAQREQYNYSHDYKPTKRKIHQIDEQNNIIATFNSISDAAFLLDLDASSITKVCKNRLKQTHGYMFQYAA